MKYLYLLSLVVLVACNNQTENVTVNNDARHNHTDEIVLDGDKKWIVDTNMMVFIRGMEDDISSFSQDKGEFSTLANDLDDKLNSLTSNCTMSGQAHDELHKWLLPFIETASELKESENTEEQEKTFAELKESFVLFNTFFE